MPVLIEEAGTAEIRDIGADAQMAPARGVIKTNADHQPIDAAAFFGPAGFRSGGSTLFSNNIRNNVSKCINACRAGRSQIPLCGV